MSDPPLRESARLRRRLAALAYDALLLVAVLGVLAALAVGLRDQRAIEPGTRWWQLTLLSVCWLFFAGFWTHGGQTPGMRAWRIRLERDDGGPVGWGRATLRFFLAWLSAGLAGAGYWWSWFDPDKRCWHDRLTRTQLISMVSPAKQSAHSQQRAARDH